MDQIVARALERHHHDIADSFAESLSDFGEILGDGRIAVILDMGILVRSARPSTLAAKPPEPELVPKAQLALVVDDSITVRRVTQRLLERNGMRVITAKDGLDAMEKLQPLLDAYAAQPQLAERFAASTRARR